MLRAKDIQIGQFYRLKSEPNYGYVKPLRVLKPMQYPNTYKYIVVECEHLVEKDSTCGFIRYFKPVDIIKC